MAKFYGKIGYAISKEISKGIWEDQIVERPYYGDVETNSAGWQTSADKINDDLTINNVISIIADTFACENFGTIKWVEWMGNKWKVSNISVMFPRLKLTLGGLYNG